MKNSNLLPNAGNYLQRDTSFSMLDDIDYQMSENEAAKQLNDEQFKLFKPALNGNNYPASRRHSCIGIVCHCAQMGMNHI